MTTKELILAYWQSWQSHENWEETRALMHDDFHFDAGGFVSRNADELIGMMQSGNPWKDIRLIDCIVEGEKGALFYEGTDSMTGARIRIAELITVRDGKVIRCIANIVTLAEV